MTAWNLETMQPSLRRSSKKTYQKLGKSKTKEDGLTRLGDYDILCGRCKNSFSNVGNRRFRVTIMMNLSAYRAAQTKKEKSQLIVSIAKTLREDVGARFLKPKGNEFDQLTEKQVHEKIGHALRDLSVSQQQLSVSPFGRTWNKSQENSQAGLHLMTTPAESFLDEFETEHASSTPKRLESNNLDERQQDDSLQPMQLSSNDMPNETLCFALHPEYYLPQTYETDFVLLSLDTHSANKSSTFADYSSHIR